MSADRVRAGYLEGVVSVVVNTVLFAVKLYFGLLCNSVAVVADAVHTFSDSLTSIVVIAGFRIASRKPDLEHPFGHGRAELIAALIIGVVLGFAAFELGVESFRRLLEASLLLFSPLLVVVLASSATVKLVLAEWAFRLAEKYSSPSIKGDAWHHRLDALVSGALAVAVLTSSEYWWFDGLAGVVISAVVLYSAIRVVLESSSELLGRAPGRDVIEKIEYLAKSTSPLVFGVHHVHVHKYGDHVEVTLHVDLPDTITLEEAHRIATLIEERIKNELGYEATVHTEPVSGKHRIKHSD